MEPLPEWAKKLSSALNPYIIQNASVGEEISRGNHDSLVTVHHQGTDYHGKKLINFMDAKTKRKDDRSSRLKKNCDLLSTLRHPNIVQFIGVTLCATDFMPVLVRETLPLSVASALDFTSKLPECLQISVTRDVSRALVYLHSREKPIVHGRITARCVYLTSGLQAKLGDVGVADLLDPNFTPGMKVVLTKSSEVAAYSPLEPVAHVTPPADVFSFGVLALHLACGKCPKPCTGTSGMSDINCRREFIDSVRGDHGLFSLIEECLQTEKSRPTASQLLKKCQELALIKPLPFSTALELMQRMERREGELMTVLERLEVEQQEVAGIGKQLNSYDKQLAAVKEQMKTMEKELMDNLNNKPLDHALNKILLPQKDTGKTNVTVDEAGNRTEPSANPVLQPTQGVFQWKSSSTAPIGMKGASAVVLEGRLYVGGGDTKDFHTDCTLYEYDINGLVHKWTPLPQCPVAYYGLGVVNRSLVLIGGMDASTRQASNHLYLWDRDKQGWNPTLPDMPTPRQHPSVAMHELFLIVAGGYKTSSNVLAEVEMFDQATFRWQTLNSLPVPCAGATTCIVRDVLYLIGGTLYGNSGPQTIVLSLPLSANNMLNSSWKVCANTPFTLSCAVAASNFILAVGGSYPGSKVPNRAIHVYFPSLDRWELLCEMPTARSSCNASVLSAGRLFVYGGKEEKTSPKEYGDTVELLMV